MTAIDLLAIAPELTLVVFGGLLVLADAFAPSSRPRLVWLSALGAAGALALRWLLPLPGAVWSGALVVDPLARFVDTYILAALLLVVIMAEPVPGPHRLPLRRVPRPPAVGRGRRHGDGQGRPPAPGLHRPRAAVDLSVRPQRLPPRQPDLPGVGLQVPGGRRLRFGPAALRHRPPVRRHRHLLAARHGRVRGHPAPGRQQAGAGRPGPGAGRSRLQAGPGAVPRLGARRLPGRADAGDGVPLGGAQGRRAGGAGAAGRVPRPPGPDDAMGAAAGDHRHRFPGARKPGGDRPARPQAHAGLLRHRPHGVRPGGHRGVRRRGVHRRCWSTWRPTPS